MAQKFNLGTGLLALIGGGLQGYNQGTAYRAQQKLQKEERDRQIANEERLFQKEQEKNEGQLLYGSALSSLLNLPTNVSLDDPVYNDLTQQALKGATMAGIDSGQALQTAFTMARAKRPQQISPLDQTKLQLDQQKILSEAALTKQREASANVSKARASYYQREAKQIKDDDLVSSINALRQLQQNLIDDLGEVPEENQEDYEAIQLQIDAYLKENARRKGVKIDVEPEPEETTKRQGKEKVDY